MKRVEVAAPEPRRPGGCYFAAPKGNIQFISTGCKVLDLALGGGWASGRIANIVGDKSTGKTLIAMEACANFSMQYPQGRIYYRESEAAFDVEYADALSIPTDRIDFGSDPLDTVEDFYEDLDKVTAKAKGEPSLYVLDSLDALSDRAELARDLDKGTFGAAKAKQMSEIFRRLVRRVRDTNTTLLVISQVRDNIGAMFGAAKYTRSGGRALDFYAAHVVYLAQIKRLKRTVGGIERVVGIRVKAQVNKNKIAQPFREAEFPIIFGYGIDDNRASLEWMKLVGSAVDKAWEPERLQEEVEKRWYEIEQSFMPTESKYS